MSLNFLNTIPIFSRGTLYLYVCDKHFKLIFNYFYSILYGFSKSGQIKYEDFRTVLLAVTYLRLNSNQTATCGAIINQLAGFGIPPGFSKLVNLLPLNGIISLSGFTVLHFKLTKELESEVLRWIGTSHIYFAIRDLRQGCNYDRILFVPIEIFEKGTITYNSFYSNICPNTKTEICTSDELKSKDPFWFVGTVLCVPAAACEMSLSLSATILFSVHIHTTSFLDFVICFGCRYMNVVGTDLQSSDLVTAALVCLFGNDNVNFGREDYVQLKPGNRVERKPLSERKPKPDQSRTPLEIVKDKNKDARSRVNEAGTPPATKDSIKQIVSAFLAIRDMQKDKFNIFLKDLEMLLLRPQLF